MPEPVTRIVCIYCGNTRAEARASEPWMHQHVFQRWTGEEYTVPVRTPQGGKGDG